MVGITVATGVGVKRGQGAFLISGQIQRICAGQRRPDVKRIRIRYLLQSSNKSCMSMLPDQLIYVCYVDCLDEGKL